MKRTAGVLGVLAALMLAATFVLPGDLPGWLNQVTVLLVVGLPMAATACGTWYYTRPR